MTALLDLPEGRPFPTTKEEVLRQFVAVHEEDYQKAEALGQVTHGEHQRYLVSRFRSSHDFRLLFSDFDCSEAEALDGAEDVIGGFGPFEGFGVLVCRVDVVEDGALQLLGGAMDERA